MTTNQLVTMYDKVLLISSYLGGTNNGAEESEQAYAVEEWKRVCEESWYYTPTEADVGHQLKVVCVPGNKVLLHFPRFTTLLITSFMLWWTILLLVMAAHDWVNRAMNLRSQGLEFDSLRW